MPDHLTAAWISFAPTGSAVGCARLFVTHALRSWGVPDGEPTSDAALIMSELVTNAVRATGIPGRSPSWSDLEGLGLIGVQLRMHGRRLVAEVWDSSTKQPRARTATDDEESGRGLLLVETMSATWGTSLPRAGGKIVYAELAVEPGAGPPTIEPLPMRVRQAVRTEPRRLHTMAMAGLHERLLEGLRGR